MRVLFIGGTGNLSYEASLRALDRGIELFHLNRGSRPDRAIPGLCTLHADVRDRDALERVLSGLRFDAVVDFIAYTPEDVARDIELFRDRAAQYVFISSASVYRKPGTGQVITESTRLHNPYWGYARAKIACERRLEAEGAASGFPYTIVRPSHTYGRGWIPSAFSSGSFTVPARILAGKEIVVPGDGQTLWTITHARDFSVGLLGLLGRAEAIGEAFQITGDEALTWDAIHLALARALGKEARIVHIPSEFIARANPAMGERLLGDKAWSSVFDCAKLKRLVPEFRTTVSLAEGLRESLAWLFEDDSRRIIDTETDAAIERILATWHRAEAAAFLSD